MENILSLNEEIDVMIKKKLLVCKCNPCTCSEQTKDKYFQELKDILANFNKINLFYLAQITITLTDVSVINAVGNYFSSV